MRVLTLELKGIRHFSRKKIDFAEGLNVVCGPNESGKSTVLDSLVAALLTPTQKEAASLKQWHTPECEIKLTYQTGDATYTITRVLHPQTKDSLEGPGVLLDDPEDIEDTLEEHIGISDKTIFENSTVVRQNEMQILQEEGARAKVRNKVRTLLSGVPERSTDDALAFLEESIIKAQTILDETEENIRTSEHELSQYKEIDEEYQKLRTKLQVYESDLARDQSLLSGYDILLEYRGKEAEYKDDLVKLEEVENLQGYIRKLPIREKELIQDLQEELEKISAHQDKLLDKKRETREELKMLKDRLTAIDDELEGIAFEKKSVFTKLGSLMKSSKAKKEELATRRVEVSQNVARLEDLLDQYEEQVVKWREKFQQKGERLRQLMEQCIGYESWSADMMETRRKEYELKMEEILQGETKEELEGIIETKRKKADELRAELVKDYTDLKDRTDTERIAIEKEKLTEIITEWEEKIDGIKARVELLSENVKKREELTEKLENLKKVKKEKLIQKKADEIAYNVISSVYQELKETFAPELEKRAETLLGRITHGRYKDIVVKKDDLDVLVKAPEHAEPVTVEVLSQGTRDQLYLCLRIALSELLSGDKNPPLLFDEAFYTFDGDRLQETLTVLQELAEITQVIVFTHDESYTQYGHPILLERR